MPIKTLSHYGCSVLCIDWIVKMQQEFIEHIYRQKCVNTQNYEIDFIITEKHNIYPIEVKSSRYKSHKSLEEFCTKFSDRIMNKYVIYTKDCNRENDIDNGAPVYM